MPKVTPSAGVVTPAYAALVASLAAGYGSGATSTHHRALVLSWFGIATDDPRLTPGHAFDPEANYTKIGARGIELALANYTKFLHDPLNAITLTGAARDTASAFALPSGREAAASAMIVDCVDMMLAYVPVAEQHYTTVWDIAKASYVATWVDTDKDGIPDDEEVPTNLVAPALTAADRDFTVTSGTWTGSPTSYEYVWYVDGVIVDGQTDTTWTAQIEVGGDVQVRVVATNSVGKSAPVLSDIESIASVG